MAKHSPHHPKVNGLNVAATDGTGRENDKCWVNFFVVGKLAYLMSSKHASLLRFTLVTMFITVIRDATCMTVKFFNFFSAQNFIKRLTCSGG